MGNFPLTLYSAQEIKRIEELAMSQLPIQAYALMCKAGAAAFAQLQKSWPQAKSVDVLCGTGNNGGDGLVLARIAKEQGWVVHVYEVGSQQSRTVECALAKEAWLKSGGSLQHFQNQTLGADVIVDALLGIGAHGILRDEFQQAIDWINQSAKPVFSIDLPSGLDANTGLSLGKVVNATATMTFLAMKQGLFCNDAIDCVGQLFFNDLDIPPTLYAQVPFLATRLDWPTLIQALPQRKLSAYKGDFGHVCVIGGGQSGYSGAVSLSGEAALRAGAGLVSAIVAPQSLSLLARAPSELMCYGPSQPEEIQSVLEKATVLVLGPGLSQTPWGKTFFEAGLKTEKCMVVDADGLNWLANTPQKRSNWILTPHPGEAARLLGSSTQEVQKNRFEAVHALQKKYGGIIVLKGAGTLILDDEQHLSIQAGGFPVLATGGTGDVLAGLIGGLLSQKLSLSFAAKIGVNVHAQAAKREQEKGRRGMLASDLFLSLRELLNPKLKQ